MAQSKRQRRKIQLGDHWMISDISGFKFPASEMKLLSGDQKGLYCHFSEWNPAHPQLKIRAREDNQQVSPVRVRPSDIFPPTPTQDEL